MGKTRWGTPRGASTATHDLGGYSILQGDSKEAVAELMQGHPHFQMGDRTSIEIVGLMPSPGT